MSIIIPGQADPNDPMVQKAMQAEQQQQQIQMMVKGIQSQVLVNCFTQFALEHHASGQPLTLESGREIAEAAANAADIVNNGYAGFLFEKLGFARMDRVDKEGSGG